MTTDFSTTTNMGSPIAYPLDVYNRISPIAGFQLPENTNGQICIVRPLGGVATNGAADLARDTYKWNATKKIFETDFTNLKTQVDRIISRGFSVFQIVLDNPSWDFQRSSTGTLRNNTYTVSTYGNALPPDNNRWAAYIREVMNFLVATYGRTEVEKIQFGIGREIGTGGHWSGTQDQFFSFYRRTVEAVRTVVPNAKVGAHFLWGSAGTNSWGPAFVQWAKDNVVPYNFVAVSYYPFYNRANRTNFSEVYRNDFGVIRNHPSWNSKAKFEIHEFALITSLNTDGNAFTSAPAEFQNSFLVGLMKQSFQNNINNIFQWGTGSQYSPSREHILALRNNVYYRNSKSGTQSSSSNYVDAIYARSFAQNRYSVMAYNYNASPTSNVSENLRFTMTLPVAGGTRYRVRSGVYNKTNNTFTYSGWTNMTTPGTGKTTSTISFDRTLPVFAFLKYEIETLSSTGKFVNNDQAKALIEDETTFANGKAVVQNISVYPNPTKEYISIEGLTGDNNQISIFDFSGKLILSTNQSKNISTNNFVSGIYFIQINNSDFIKFIKE